MWDSILVYIFEFIIEAMMMMLNKFVLWYDTLYDDNTFTLYDVDALLYNMMYTHTIVWWFSYALWCIIDVDDAYTVHTDMMMMHIWWWGCIPYGNDAYLWWWCMPYVQWNKSIITCSIIVYDEVYNDVHE